MSEPAPEALEVVRRLEQRVPPGKLLGMLLRMADRLDELAKTGSGADLELHLRVVRGRFHEARWDADERL